jgi:hypothetical protein
VKTRTVGLYGSNLMMSAIGISLREKAEFQVQQFEMALLDIAKTPNAAWPDVVLFDLATAPHDLAISLLQHHPATTLIGIDLTNNKMLVVSGEQSHLATADDLVKVIEGGRDRQLRY